MPLDTHGDTTAEAFDVGTTFSTPAGSPTSTRMSTSAREDSGGWRG
ncbi:hypothetical protein QMA10_17340 [Arthrobacter sp. APC 3897]|nr:hypothetical protein [Arthrobacter sp. APC 3897]MDN3483674.1 hypothetical protein [Arthrobacter sp. APC 3897]